jgi:hypothetical protein
MIFEDSNVVPFGFMPGMGPGIPDFGLVQLKEKKRQEDRARATATQPHMPTQKAEAVILKSTALTKLQTSFPSGNRISFFSLPLEIRLQIYSYVHVTTPLHEPELAPWLPNPKLSAWFLQAVMPGLALPPAPDFERGTYTYRLMPTSTPRPLLSPRRPRNGLPSALLCASTTVYEEARAVPFRDNEFAFANWFSSGVQTARAFSSRLTGWQREALRFARVEVPVRDLQGTALAEWTALCAMWSGLRGLRLRVECVPTGWLSGTGEDDQRRLSPLRMVQRPWVREGLMRLQELRQLEIELAGSSWSDVDKVEWCRELEEEMNARRRERDEELVYVVCVERLVVEKSRDETSRAT